MRVQGKNAEVVLLCASGIAKILQTGNIKLHAFGQQTNRVLITFVCSHPTHGKYTKEQQIKSLL